MLTYDPNVFIHIKPNLIEEGRHKIIVDKINVATQQLKDLFRMNRSLLYTVYFSHRDYGCFCQLWLDRMLLINVLIYPYC